jgi:hypothetical protein
MIDKAVPDEIKEYSYGALSFIDEKGYPFSIPSIFDQKGEKLVARKPKSITCDFVRPRAARIAFHRVNENFTNPRQILLKGQITETKEGELMFKAESFSRGKVTRRDVTDKYVKDAKKRAQEYLDQKGITWYRIAEY